MQHEELPDGAFSIATHALSMVPVAVMFGFELRELRSGEAVMAMPMRDEMRQLGGVLHGGITATLIDTAMAFAIRTVIPFDEPTATIDLTIHYLRPHTEGEILCTATVVRAGKRIITVSSEILNAEGKAIATALSTYTRL
jgi:acyl-CoA thioesterase